MFALFRSAPLVLAESQHLSPFLVLKRRHQKITSKALVYRRLRSLALRSSVGKLDRIHLMPRYSLVQIVPQTRLLTPAPVLALLRLTSKAAPYGSAMLSLLVQQTQETILMPSTTEACATACDLLSLSVPLRRQFKNHLAQYRQLLVRIC